MKVVIKTKYNTDETMTFFYGNSSDNFSQRPKATDPLINAA